MRKITLLFAFLFFAWQFQAQVTDNFDSYNTGDDPAGWTKYQTGTDDPGFIVTSSRSNSSPNSLYHNDDNLNAVSTSWIVAPVYTSTGNDQLSFYYNQNMTGSFYNYSGVWYSTTGSDPTQNPGDWTEIAEFNGTDQPYSEDTWTQFTYNFNLAAGTTIYVAFKYTGDWSHEFYIDDFVLDVVPACPDPNGLNATSLSLTEAQLSWNETGSATTWNIEYGPSGFTQGNGTTITGVTSNPYTLTGLTAGQEYDFYVQSDCGGGDTSNWVGPFTWKQMDNGDTCAYPVSLTVNSDCSTATPYTLDYANSVDLGHFSCDSYGANNGKWFSFVAPSSGKVKMISSVSGGEFALFDDCGGTELFCDNAGTSFEFTGLTAGQTYYIAYWKDAASSGTVDICLEELLYVNPVFTTTVSPDCSNNQFNVDVEVTDLGGASSVTVSDDQGSATQQLTAPGTVTFGPYASGTNVTFTVTNNDNNSYTATDNVQYICPPANDTCDTAKEISSLTYTDTMDATGATNNNGFIDCNGNGMNDGVWYKLTVGTVNGDITVQVDPNGWDAEVAVYSGDCANLSCEGRSDSGGSGGTETVTFTPTSGTTYYINVGYWSSSTDGAEGPFTITVSGNVTLSNEILSAEEFTFWPNPTEDKIYFQSAQTPDRIEIVSLQGQVLMSKNANDPQHWLDISELSKGVYLMNVYLDGKKGVYRIIKK